MAKLTVPRKLTSKENDFCRFYARTPDINLAAAHTGVDPSLGEAILARPEAAALISLYAEDFRRQALLSVLTDGLQKLALSPGTDILRLARLSSDIRSGCVEAGEWPLQNVSEVKLPKDGGVEIKFFDRSKLLESLCDMAAQEDSGKKDSGLIEAIRLSAQALDSIGGAAPTPR